MKDLYRIFSLFLIIIFLGCSEDIPKPQPEPDPDPDPPVVVIKDGLSYSETSPDADKPLTITFKAVSGSGLFGYTGDVYVHIGVVSEGIWQYVPAEWTQNLPKCKMTKKEANIWSITLEPTIRQWFNSGTTPVNKIGIVIRSSDGAKKGITADSFIPVTDSKYKGFEPAAIKNAPLPENVIYGINVDPIDKTKVTLVLYDKDKSGARKDFAHVVGDFNNWTLSNDDKSQMNRDDATGCWWITINGLDPTKEYAFQYYVGTKAGEVIRLADAYSHKILDPDNDKYISTTTYSENLTYPAKGAIGIVSVFKTQDDVYNWQVTDFKMPDRDNLVIYELLLRDFTTTGDINGVMGKLDYLETLGVNAIELMPVQEFDGNDSWGYNPAFFFALDKAYGTDRMYKQFIDECHKRGIAVIFDVVYNHATGANPFAKLYWDSNTNKTKSNNPYFNVDAPHPYSVFHDFNHESPLVREFVKRNLEFLLEEYNIDGFRFDLSKGFTQKNSSESNAHIYDPTRIAILKDYNSTIKAKKADAIVIMEHFADNQEETELANAGMMVWRNMNNAYCQSAMGYKEDSDFSGTYYGTSSRPENSLVSYMESHDEERAAYKQTQYGNGYLKTDLKARMNQLSANAAFFFTVPGPKMIWQFGELGYDISINENGRTGKKPVKWEYQGNADRNKLLSTYTRLVDLRMSHSELFKPTAELVWKVTPTFWETGRFLTLSSFGKAKNVVVVANFTNTPITTSTKLPATGTWYNYMNTTESIQVTSSTINITVPANGFMIYTSFR